MTRNPPLPFCLALDWGTSSLRLWLLAESGEVLAERSTKEGLLAIARDGFADMLERHLRALAVADDLPVVICGMAGSRQGWREAPYLESPALLTDLAAHAAVVDGLSRQVRILPGVATRRPLPDVMRGEETQLLGILELLTESSLVCIPGTHSKWVHVENRRVRDFATFMTGEIFALLSTRSLLRHSVAPLPDVTFSVQPFTESVTAAFHKPEAFSRLLFALRASSLLEHTCPEEAYWRLSGLVIGIELAGARAFLDDFPSVNLLASGVQAALYAHALEAIGIGFRSFDASNASRAGLLSAARILWAG